MGENERGICTIISGNYLAYARVLAESFLKYNRGKVFVLLADKPDENFDREKERFVLIEIDKIKKRIPDFRKFCFQYNITELNTAVKPFFIEFLFENYNLQKLVFFDPDILITSALEELFVLLDKFSIILTPHITRPFSDNRKPSEIEILRSGVYNLGFLALANRDSAKVLLKWWQERLKRYCKIDFKEGLFVDQKWIDLVPCFFDDVLILRDQIYNIAYWNYHYRRVRLEGEAFFVNDRPAAFLHFSGFEPDNDCFISKHQNRYTFDDLSVIKPVFQRYKDLLSANGYNESKKKRSVFDYFTNGIRISDITRKIFWRINNPGNDKFFDPFDTSTRDNYFEWLNKNTDIYKPPITNFMLEIYRMRPDLQLAYPDIYGFDRKSFVDWFIVYAARDYEIEEPFMKNIILPLEKGRMPAVYLIFRVMNKARMILKKFLQKICASNLMVPAKLRRVEMYLYRKIMGFRRVSIKKSSSMRDPGGYGVNITGYLTAELGIGEAARANIRSIESAGIKFSLINISYHTFARQRDFSFSHFSRDNPHYFNLLHINGDMFFRFYLEKGAGYFRNRYNIGFWNWELPHFPQEWCRNFSYCNEIWAPSSFTLMSIAKKSPVPVLRIPIAVEVNEVKPVEKTYFGLNENDFVFLFIFDFFSYFERKNPLSLIDAFKKAFLPSENARLIIKCSNSSYDPAAMNLMKKSCEGINANIIDKYLYRQEINALISLCDCYISLHRCEGFGLTLAEAMFLGKPVIATGYSGNTDFMNINNSYLVKYALIEINKDTGPYRKGSVWAEPDINHAAELMRDIFEHRESAKKTGLTASQDIRAALNYKVIGKEIKQRFEYILNG